MSRRRSQLPSGSRSQDRSDGVLIYRATVPVRHARILRWIVVGMAVGILLGSPPLLPVSVSGLAHLVVALALLGAGAIYGRCVPARLELTEDELRIQTVGLLGCVHEQHHSPWVISSRLLSSDAGGYYTPDMTLLRLRGRRLPLLIDSRAERDQTSRLASARESDAD